LNTIADERQWINDNKIGVFGFFFDCPPSPLEKATRAESDARCPSFEMKLKSPDELNNT
jgi:hypothetical protein